MFDVRGPAPWKQQSLTIWHSLILFPTLREWVELKEERAVETDADSDEKPSGVLLPPAGWQTHLWQTGDFYCFKDHLILNKWTEQQSKQQYEWFYNNFTPKCQRETTYRDTLEFVLELYPTDLFLQICSYCLNRMRKQGDAKQRWKPYRGLLSLFLPSYNHLETAQKLFMVLKLCLKLSVVT